MHRCAAAAAPKVSPDFGGCSLPPVPRQVAKTAANGAVRRKGRQRDRAPREAVAEATLQAAPAEPSSAVWWAPVRDGVFRAALQGNPGAPQQPQAGPAPQPPGRPLLPAAVRCRCTGGCRAARGVEGGVPVALVVCGVSARLSGSAA